MAGRKSVDGKESGGGAASKRARGAEPTKAAAATKTAVTTKAATTKKAAEPAAKSMPKAGKDPAGGLTAKGREYFAKKEGSHLRPGVQGPADTPEKMVRKGSFLRRHFANPRGPMKDEKGEPTRLALSAHAWGEPVPQTTGDAKRLAAEGHELLEQYHAIKDGGAGKTSRRKPAKTSTAKRATSTAKRASKAEIADDAPKSPAAKKTAAKMASAKKAAAKKGTK